MKCLEKYNYHYDVDLLSQTLTISNGVIQEYQGKINIRTNTHAAHKTKKKTTKQTIQIGEKVI